MFQKLGWALALTLTMQMAAASSANAEGRDVGNGGGVWACREGQDVTGALRWVRLVDIDEAVGEWGQTLVGDTYSVEAWLLWVSNRIHEQENPLFRHEYEAAFQEHLATVQRMIHIQGGRSLPVIDDSLYMSTPAPETCDGGTVRYEQLANYNHTSGLVLVDARLYNGLSNLEKAALYVHEAIYALLRATDPVHGADSRRARRITGLLFSSGTDEELQRFLRLPDTRPLSGAYRMERAEPLSDFARLHRAAPRLGTIWIARDRFDPHKLTLTVGPERRSAELAVGTHTVSCLPGYECSPLPSGQPEEYARSVRNRFEKESNTSFVLKLEGLYRVRYVRVQD